MEQITPFGSNSLLVFIYSLLLFILYLLKIIKIEGAKKYRERELF
jgi:hypothetical protein|tara:strand:+ start:724 stop:858 length:135 start_codon:yes stop_codon:yes gene_type:complete